MTQGHDKVSVHPDAAHKAPRKPQAALLYYLLLFVISSWAEAPDSQMGFWWFLSLISLKDYHCCEMSVTWALHRFVPLPRYIRYTAAVFKGAQVSSEPSPGQVPTGTHRWQAVLWDLAPVSLQPIAPGQTRCHSCFSHIVPKPLPTGHYHRSAILRRSWCDLLSIFMATNAAKPTKTSSTREDWQLHAVWYCISYQVPD